MTETNRALCHRALRRALHALLALACLQVSQAFAGFEHVQGSSGWTVNWNQGVLQPTPQWMPTGTIKAGNAGYSIQSGVLAGQAFAKFPFPNGNTIDVAAKVIPDRPSVGGALLNFAKKTVFPLQVGLAVYDLIKELGMDATKDAAGNITWKKTDPTLCTVAPCTGYYYRYIGTNYRDYTMEKAARKACTYYYGPNQTMTYSTNLAGYLGPGWSCGVQNLKEVDFWTASIAPADPATSMVAATESDFTSKISTKTDFAGTSKLPQAVSDALNSGETITAPAPTLSGPATAAGPSSTTVANGNTTVKSDTYNITYNGNQVTYNTVTTTTVNGVQTEQSTKSADQPATDCQRYPQSIGCANLDVPTDTIPKATKSVTYTAENLGFAGGTCPADKYINVHRMSAPVKVFDWTDTCSKIVNYAKPMIITLATFSALLIVFGARVEL